MVRKDQGGVFFVLLASFTRMDLAVCYLTVEEKIEARLISACY